MQSLKDEIYKVLKPLFSQKGEVFAELALKWSDIIGHEYAAKIAPIKVSKQRVSDKEVITLLTVKCNSSSAALTISFTQYQIIERINNYFGFRAIEKLKIKV